MLDNPGPTNILAVGLVGGVIGKTLFGPITYKFVKAGGIGLDFASAMLNVFDGFGKLFCHWQKWGIRACDDTTTFPDARKWDVSSLAAKVTDIICAEESWQRDDPRAMFVFRGLVTGPSMLQAATLPEDMPGIYKNWYVNPIGSVMQVDAMAQNPTSYWTYNGGDNIPNLGSAAYFSNGWVENNLSITGSDSTSDAWKSLKDHNRYACNNFDVIWKGGESTADADGNENQGDQVASDELFAANLKKWAYALRDAAHDPNNLVKQGIIPGLANTPGYPPFDYDEATYLATCMNDFTNSNAPDEPLKMYGTGFNKISERGAKAATYNPPTDLYTIETQEQALLLANWCFTFPSEEAAFQFLVKGNVQYDNIIKIVHYWHEPKEFRQNDDFNINSQWRSNTEDIKKALDTQPPVAWKFPLAKPPFVGEPVRTMPIVTPLPSGPLRTVPGVPQPVKTPAQSIMQHCVDYWATTAAGQQYPFEYWREYVITLPGVANDAGLWALVNNKNDGSVLYAQFAFLVYMAENLFDDNGGYGAMYGITNDAGLSAAQCSGLQPFLQTYEPQINVVCGSDRCVQDWQNLLSCNLNTGV